VTKSEGKELAAALGAGFFEVSARAGASDVIKVCLDAGVVSIRTT
jgi:hypothetical protein